VVRAEAGIAVAAELAVADAIRTDNESSQGEGLERRQETPLLRERQEEDDLGSGDTAEELVPWQRGGDHLRLVARVAERSDHDGCPCRSLPARN
jgi:hypothetical protein